MAKRKMNEMDQSAKPIEEKKAEMNNKIIKLNDEKTELMSKLLEKTEECCELKLKVKEIETKNEKLEENMKGFKEMPMTSLGGRQRKISPCKDREAVYAMMEGWNFQGEIDKMNFKLLRWMDEILNIIGPVQITRSLAVTPKKFMEYLADEFMLVRLAKTLGEKHILYSYPTDKKKCYEYFYKFAKEEAKLAEGCIFLEEELFGETYEDYKSVFYTLYKLANQAKDKFNKMILWEVEDENVQVEIVNRYEDEDKEGERRRNIAENKIGKRLVNIILKTLKGKTITLNCSTTETIKKIKEKIYEKEGIRPDQQRIFFADKKLEDYHTLAYYKIQNGSMMLMELYLAGC